MEIITADFETYYDKEYSLTKLTTEAYVRDPRFEVIMLGLRWPDGTTEVVTGTHADIKYRLDAVDWGKYAVLCHNTMFDSAIFSWLFDVNPRAWLDTLSMARAMFGSRNNSLAMLAKRYGFEDKGTEVQNAMGKRREDFTPEEFSRYAAYCLHDVKLCYDMWHTMSEGWYNIEEFDKRDNYPLEELRLIDRHIRMFSEPVLRLNKEKLEAHLAGVIKRKEELLSKTEFSKERLSSNPQFAEVLKELGVEPPIKISKTTGKPTFAFAKTDPELKALLDHPDERVQTAVAARLGTKSTLEETRTSTFIDIVKRNSVLPVPLKYSYARTKRTSGGDNINLQNLPARGGTELKACIEAPPGYVLVDSDSSNIEARVLAWLARQDDLVEDFANGVDVYCKMASRIYGRPITKANKSERFLGKTVVVGCGYQTGAFKLQATLKTANPPMDLDIQECQRIIDVYRMTNSRIKNLWYEAEQCIESMHANKTRWLGREGVLLIEGKKGVRLPSGLYVSYPQLHRAHDPNRQVMRWQYKDDTGLVDIYGGKFVENCTQALARIIVMSQLLRIAKKYRVALTVHDSILAVVREAELGEARAYIESCMRWVPPWAAGLPINCESKWGYNYGEMADEE
jgi:DNA polymerase I-like protein with 3'-5' exonuclease and polymerase domains